MKKLLFLLVVFISIVGCNSNKKLEQSFLEYKTSESLGVITKYKIDEFEILDTITNKQIVISEWTWMNDISNTLNGGLLNEFLIQENQFKDVGEDYYEFAKKHKGASSFIDEYLDIMEKSLKIKKQGIDESSVSEKVEIIMWFVNRKNYYWGNTGKITSPISVDSMKVIEKIMGGEETLEYFRVRIKYSFVNPILNNTVVLDEVFHFNMLGKCFSSEEYETNNK